MFSIESTRNDTIFFIIVTCILINIHTTKLEKHRLVKGVKTEREIPNSKSDISGHTSA